MLSSVVTICIPFSHFACHVLRTVDSLHPDKEVCDDIAQFVAFFNQAELLFGEPYQESMNEWNSYGGNQILFVQLGSSPKPCLQMN
jgi:hypothetical protein